MRPSATQGREKESGGTVNCKGQGDGSGDAPSITNRRRSNPWARPSWKEGRGIGICRRRKSAGRARWVEGQGGKKYHRSATHVERLKKDLPQNDARALGLLSE